MYLNKRITAKLYTGYSIPIDYGRFRDERWKAVCMTMIERIDLAENGDMEVEDMKGVWSYPGKIAWVILFLMICNNPDTYPIYNSNCLSFVSSGFIITFCIGIICLYGVAF